MLLLLLFITLIALVPVLFLIVFALSTRSKFEPSTRPKFILSKFEPLLRLKVIAVIALLDFKLDELASQIV
jgi:hypothetical protein